MNGNYQLSRFLVEERVTNHLKAAEAHRQAKLAPKSGKVGFSVNYLVKVSNRIGQKARWLVVQAENVFRPAVAH